MTTNRDIIDARILNYFKSVLSPDYRVINVRTRWVGQRDGEKFFDVRYFVTSPRFIGGVRYDRVGVCDKEVRIQYDNDI
jgi:hypothetical protein